MTFIIINFITSFFIEKVVASKSNKWWKSYKMKKIRRRLEEDREKKANLNLINNVKNYIHLHKTIKWII